MPKSSSLTVIDRLKLGIVGMFIKWSSFSISILKSCCYINQSNVRNQVHEQKKCYASPCNSKITDYRLFIPSTDFQNIICHKSQITIFCEIISLVIQLFSRSITFYETTSRILFLLTCGYFCHWFFYVVWLNYLYIV
jgi:hypothetical protein